MDTQQARRAAHVVAAKLFAAENAIDDAITCLAELAGELPRARRDAGVSAVVGQDALERVLATLPGLGAVRADLVAAHRRLDETKSAIGMRSVAVGGGGAKPDDPPHFAEPMGRLRAVGE